MPSDLFPKRVLHPLCAEDASSPDEDPFFYGYRWVVLAVFMFINLINSANVIVI